MIHFRIAARTALVLALVLGPAAGAAGPAAAKSDAGQQSHDDYFRLSNSAEAYFNQAEAEQARGSYSSACNDYRSAAAQWHNAIMASLGMLSDPDRDQQSVRDANAGLDRNKAEAERRAGLVCGKTDEVISSPSDGGGGGGGGGQLDAEAAVAAVQTLINEAGRLSQAAEDRYEANDRPGACEAARAAAKVWAKARRDYDVVPNADVAALEKITTNANQSATDVDGYYCKGLPAQ